MAPKRTVLAIIGSMRRMGNCELFVKAVSENIPVEHELALVRLPDLNILPCRGCYACVAEGTCRIRDDIPFLIDRIVSSDALIIAAPVYFLGAHASVKRLLDRAFSFFSAVEKISKKPSLLVNTYGMENRIGTAPQALLTLCLLSRSRGKGKRQPAGCLARRDPGNEEAPRMRVQARQASLH